MSKNIINVDSLNKYHQGLKVTYLDPLEKKIDGFESGDKFLNEVTRLDEKIDENVGTINSQLEHIEKKEVISIMDFGAIGDKVNDDTDAIKKALKSGRHITAKGEKHYIISDVIEVPKYVTLDFNNAFVTFTNSKACFKLNQYSSIKNVKINIEKGVLLNKSVIYIDGNDVYHVGWTHTPNVENISIEDKNTIGTEYYRQNIGIWLDASQNEKNTTCCVTGVLVENVKATLLKHIIYMSVGDRPYSTNKVYITSNTFRNILGYNCACFIKDEIISGSSANVGVGSNVYDNLHFQPADDIETCYLDICGDGNSITNALFWDNSRPSNKTGQIIVRGSFNSISGAVIPPYKSSYVDIQGNYNFYQGSTYGIPTQYFGGKYISGRGYQKEWKGKLLPMTYTYSKSTAQVKSGLIEGSKDNKAIELPLTYGDLDNGLTKITFRSVGTCGKNTQVRRIWIGFGGTNFRCGGSTSQLYAEQYDANAEFIIRKYQEGYADVVLTIKFMIGGETVSRVYTNRYYNITNDMEINPRLLLGSTTNEDMTQLYSDIKIDFHE